MNKTFVFDYDDTIVPNEYHYTIAQSKFLEWLLTKLGPKTPDTQYIVNLIAATNVELQKTLGFSKKRYPTAFREVYTRICEHIKEPASKGDLAEAYDLGWLPFDKRRYKRDGLLEGAAETLDFLVSGGDELILLTKGDYKVQQEKIEATGMKKWFGDEMHIVPRKDSGILLGIVGERDKKQVYHVGNSVRSDANPALEAGLKMILILYETWAYERQHDGIPKSRRLKQFDSILDIKRRYDEL